LHSKSGMKLFKRNKAQGLNLLNSMSWLNSSTTWVSMFILYLWASAAAQDQLWKSTQTNYTRSHPKLASFPTFPLFSLLIACSIQDGWEATTWTSDFRVRGYRLCMHNGNTSIKHSPGKEFIGSNLKQTPSLGNFRVRIPTFGKRGYNSFMICKREVRKQETYKYQWRYSISDTID